MPYSSELYIHELDRKAFNALDAFPKLVRLRELYLANTDEKAQKIDLMSTAIRVSENQFPEIYRLLPPICEKLDIPIPELYYSKSKELNAYSTGNTYPMICITSRLVNELPSEMLGSVLAHECGHIACKHFLYHSIALSLINGIENSYLPQIPGMQDILDTTLTRALLVWYRCSELSADRAAILCENNPDRYIDLMLRLHGYKNINRDEFLKQAVDLNEFVNDSQSNKFIQVMISQDCAHPLLAARVYECHTWAESQQFSDILSGTYTLQELKKEQEKSEEQEVISADVPVEVKTDDLSAINAKLNEINIQLEENTVNADKLDYAVAVGSGIISGIIDSVYVGDVSIETNNDFKLSNKSVNNFFKAIKKGVKQLDTKIQKSEDILNNLQNNDILNQIGIEVPAMDNIISGITDCLTDLAHNPTPIGLLCAVVVRFLKVGVLTKKKGEWHFNLEKITSGAELSKVLIPAVIAGIINWVVDASNQRDETVEEEDLPKSVKALVHLAASAPILAEIAKCSDKWYKNIVDNKGNYKNMPAGILGIFLSLFKEISALPEFRNSKLPALLDKLCQKPDNSNILESVALKSVGKQIVPVAFNEIIVRTFYFIRRFIIEVNAHDNMNGITWDSVMPFQNRTVDRMLTVASMTFSLADTADAAVHAALESGANWVLFSGRFVTRFNYVGAGRAALAICKEISYEAKETQLIHEKMLLSEQKAEIFLAKLQEFKSQLDEKVSNYLAEDISSFMEGFNEINKGLSSNNSDLVIHGNIIIQKVLGREPQFTNQQEFDELMESDIPLIL